MVYLDHGKNLMPRRNTTVVHEEEQEEEEDGSI
jgi:hypothetical protein